MSYKLTQFYIVAGAGVVADSEYFSREHSVDWCARLGREVETGMMLVASFAEGIAASAETGGNLQSTFQWWMAPCLGRWLGWSFFPII